MCALLPAIILCVKTLINGMYDLFNYDESLYLSRLNKNGPPYLSTLIVYDESLGTGNHLPRRPVILYQVISILVLF